MNLLLGLIGALAVGAAGNMVYDFPKYGTLRVPYVLKKRQALSDEARAHNSIDDGLHPFITWSHERPLTRIDS